MSDLQTNTRFYSFGRFRLDAKERVLFCNGEPLNLPPKVFDTLLALIVQNGHIVERDDLMNQVWAETFVEEGNLSVNISLLRKTLGKAENGKEFIETIPRRGYRFRAELEETDSVDEMVLTRRVTAKIRTTVEETAPKEEIKQLPAAPVSVWRSKYLFPVLAVLILSAIGLTFYLYKRPPPINSLAVLPFKNESGDQTLESLSDGLSESLINRLSQLPQMKVIAQSSSFRFKGKDADPREAAQTLGVQALVTGSVKQEGDNLIVNVELIDAKDGTRIWSEQYKIGLADAQNVQRQIARRIASQLRLNLTEAQNEQLAKRDTQNSAAYQLYLNGLLVRRKGGVESTKKAIEYFNQAITLDPNFALAYNHLANSYRSLQFSSGVGDRKEFKEKMYQAAAKALELDETMPEIHLTLGAIKMNELDWAGAEREYKRAIELNPNLSAAHGGYANFLSNFERHAEALTEAKLAQELDPLSVNNKIGVGKILMLARRYDEAIEYLQNLNKTEPNNGRVHYLLAETYTFKGMYAESLAEFEKAKGIEGNSIGIFYASALAKSGKRDEARKTLEQIKTSGDYSPAELAIGYIALGEKDEAFALLEKAFGERDLQLQFLRVDPNYDEIRSDTRFQDLLRRVGLFN